MYVVVKLPFDVVIMRDIFREIPMELQEAAFLDGANDLRVFARINLPLAINGLIATAVIVFAFNWNEAIPASTLSSLLTITGVGLIGAAATWAILGDPHRLLSG